MLMLAWTMKTHLELTSVIGGQGLLPARVPLVDPPLIPISMALFSPAVTGAHPQGWTAGCVVPVGDAFQHGAVAHMCLAMSCWMGRAAARVSSAWLLSSSLPWDLCCVEDSGLRKQQLGRTWPGMNCSCPRVFIVPLVCGCLFGSKTSQC